MEVTVVVFRDSDLLAAPMVFAIEDVAYEYLKKAGYKPQRGIPSYGTRFLKSIGKFADLYTVQVKGA